MKLDADRPALDAATEGWKDWLEDIPDRLDDIPDQERPTVVGLVTGVDWLTITAKSPDARRAMMLESERLADALQQIGEELRDWRFCGYVGKRIGSLRYGFRSDSSLIMLSGQDAFANWQAFVDMAENVTRLDLAVTVETDIPWIGLVSRLYAWMTYDNPDGRATDGRKITKIENNAGGATLYIGSRASDQYGRLYDKAAESGIEELRQRLWRYEVEFKRDRAGKALKGLVRAYRESAVDHVQAIRNTVWTWFDCRNCPPIFDRNGDALSLELEARVTSTEATLQWLSRQVAPSIARLATAGYLRQACEALGLEMFDWLLD
jgi:DNA relaxase NicK